MSYLLPDYLKSYNKDAELVEMPKIKVLLADDHAMIREGTKRILEESGSIEVIGEASDGSEAIRQAIAMHPDVVLMDIAMPKLDGVKATEEIKEKLPSTAVLILSAYDDDAYLFPVLKAGAAGYLLKNCRGSELVDAVKAVVRGESVLHPVVAAKVLKSLSHSPEEENASEGLLTKREIEVLKTAASGMSNKDIAQTLNLSSRTVQAHLSNIFNKLNVGSRTEAIIVAFKQGIIDLIDVIPKDES